MIYTVSWEESTWYDVTIAADTPEQALEMWHRGEYGSGEVVFVGQEVIPGTVEVV